MPTILLAPDSFKETMSSQRVCEIMTAVIRRYFPDWDVRSVPIADGGEGMVDCFLAAQPGARIAARVAGPWAKTVDGFYGLLSGGHTAVVEMAAAAGLPLVGERKDPSGTTTLGVGQLIEDALGRGAARVVLGLGGSATNDGGCGMAAALGARFWNEQGEEFVPVGATLHEIARMDVSEARRALAGVALVVMCDIDNPLCGEQGAAHIFGPQKGADEEMVRRLDRGLAHLARVSGQSALADTPGAGAAGGLGFMAALLGGHLRPGIEAVLDIVDFDALLRDARLVFTGEGRMDGQSLRGKVVLGVAGRARKRSVPVIAVVGDAVDEGLASVYERGVTAVFSTNRIAGPFEQTRRNAARDLENTMDNILRVLRTAPDLFRAYQ